MRFVTFNLWHGLAPSSPVAFEELEPAGRKVLREELQYEVLRELQPDICFFQETNPVGVRAEHFATELGMDFCFQPDLVGLKLFGLGIPYNLNSGLLTMARRPLGLKCLEGVSLSRPGTHLVHSWGSWQLKEERFALFSETMLPKWGRVLLINTHLHHGLEATPEFLSELENLAKEMELSDGVVSELKSRLAAGAERRARELAALLEAVQRYESRYEVVILGGDFNASPETQFGGELRDAGFVDVWREASAADPGLTFDSTRNQANHRMLTGFPITLMVEDLSFSSKVKEALMSLARRQEARPRRIDYLWMRANSSRLEVTSARIFGQPNSEGLAPSDHFGVCADIELR